MIFDTQILGWVSRFGKYFYVSQVEDVIDGGCGTLHLPRIRFQIVVYRGIDVGVTHHPADGIEFRSDIVKGTAGPKLIEMANIADIDKIYIKKRNE